MANFSWQLDFAHILTLNTSLSLTTSNREHFFFKWSQHFRGLHHQSATFFSDNEVEGGRERSCSENNLTRPGRGSHNKSQTKLPVKEMSVDAANLHLGWSQWIWEAFYLSLHFNTWPKEITSSLLLYSRVLHVVLAQESRRASTQGWKKKKVMWRSKLGGAQACPAWIINKKKAQHMYERSVYVVHPLRCLNL